MSKLRYKEIEKMLPKEHDEIVFNIVGFVRKKGLNRQEFVYIREKIYEEAEKLFENQVPSGNSFQKRLEQLSTKLCAKALRKSPLEFLANICFVIFAILSVVFPIVYGVSFSRDSQYGLYSNGIYFYLNLANLFMGYLYLCIGVLVSLLIQPIEKGKKLKIIGLVFLIFLVVGIIIYALAGSFPDFIFKINFIIFEIIFIALSIGSYFLENYLSKKAFNLKHPGVKL